MKPIAQLYMPGPPPKGLNGSDGLARRSVKQYMAEEREWDGRVLEAWVNAGRPRLDEPVALVWIRLFAGRERPMDATNLLASAKVPEDALVRRGFLREDSADRVVQSIALQRKVEPSERGLIVLAFPGSLGIGFALSNVAHWVGAVWEKEHAWRSVLGEHSEPFAEGRMFPKEGATGHEWLHGTSWSGAKSHLSRSEVHLELIHQLVDTSRGWEARGLVNAYVLSIRQALARMGVNVRTHSYTEKRVLHGENRGVRLRLHEPTDLAKATA